MATPDISRQLFQPEKRYIGTYMQQGRVVTDEDLNAHRRLDAEDERLTFRDIICSKGSPNHGFRIGTPTPVDLGLNLSGYDFPITNGSFYVGGLRFESLEEQPETLLAQRDWLQINVDPGTLPSIPVAADLTDMNGNPIDRHDLVYLRGWEQCVSAVEDRELLEYALGGPDTSVFQRRQRRIQVLAGVSDDCVAAFDELIDNLAAPLPGDGSGDPHPFDHESCELLSKARLTVGFTGGPPSDDLCQPPVLGGYLGAENQAIRVQLTATNRFIWGYDNAAPLYRVQVVEEEGLDVIRFLTLPRDEFAQPVSGQAVEILPWGALLPNQEKTAEWQGHLTTVATGFDPDTGRITVETPVPQAWLDWLNDPAHAGFLNDRDEPGTQRYFYLRVWSGGSGNAAQPDHNFVPGTAVPLGDTGLEVTFSDFGLPGSYWVVAVRPNTPDEVVPWILTEDAPAFGPRQYIASLALIRWSIDPVDGAVISSVIDCRTRFRPLCQLRGCCTIVVGDGHSSHGEFTSIQEAVEALPPGGGEICVLPGTYEESVRIEDRHDVHICGCGSRTGVVGTGPETVFEIVDSSNIKIATLAIKGEGAIGIHAHVEDEAFFEGIRLDRLELECRDRAAIVIESTRHAAIKDCDVTVLPRLEPLATDVAAIPEPAVFVQGEHICIEGNRVRAAEAEAAAFRAFGGVQIGGDSRDVEIRRNHIRGGNNHGIILGSVVTREVDGELPESSGYLAGGGWTIVVDENGCIRIEPIPPEPGPDDPIVETEAGPPLYEVRIIENLIEDMGMSGISVARFFEMEDNPDFITVVDLLIERNRIRNCVGLLVPQLPAGLREVIGFGGVALADVERLNVRDNRIEANGAESLGPVCGVFVLHGEGIAIDRNHILDNGLMDTQENPLRPGRRGAIVLSFARAPVGPELAPLEDVGVEGFVGARQTGVPAAHIHDNIAVSPAGRALEIIALGPVSVEGNELTARGSIFRNDLTFVPGTTNTGGPASVSQISYGAIAASTNPVLALMDRLGGSAVAIFNLGFSNEVYLQLLGLSGLFLLDDLPTPEAAEDIDDPRYFVGGNILFNDNQVVLDAFAPGITITLSSVLLFTLDDVSMHGNQCDCDLLIDIAILNALVVGWSIRVADNRLKEGLLNTLFSGITLALMNETTDNQSTHCLYPIGVPIVSNRTHNHALVQLGNVEACRTFGDRIGTFYGVG